MGISKPAAERLARLARLLEHRSEMGHKERVLPSVLEQITGLPSHVICKDIAQLPAAQTEGGFSATAGYEPEALAARIREALGLEREVWNCCIVGLGRLGSSFLECDAFEGTPFCLSAGFDSNVNRIEMLESAVPLYPTFRMKEIIPRLDIRLALLCVPAESAQETAQKLFSLKVSGIVNFTSAAISAPEGTVIANVSVIDALEALTAGLSSNKNNSLKEK